MAKPYLLKYVVYFVCVSEAVKYCTTEMVSRLVACLCLTAI